MPMNGVANTGPLHILSWLHRMMGAADTTRGVDMTAIRGYVDVLEYLKDEMHGRLATRYGRCCRQGLWDCAAVPGIHDMAGLSSSIDAYDAKSTEDFSCCDGDHVDEDDDDEGSTKRL